MPIWGYITIGANVVTFVLGIRVWRLQTVILRQVREIGRR